MYDAAIPAVGLTDVGNAAISLPSLPLPSALGTARGAFLAASLFIQGGGPTEAAAEALASYESAAVDSQLTAAESGLESTTPN